MLKTNILKQDLKPSATVVDDVLVLSLPNAVNPTVWRWDLADIKASALEVRPNDDDSYKLILKTPKGDVQDVAPFDSNEAALSALLAVSKAMEQTRMQAAKPNTAGNNHAATQGETKKVLMGLAALILIIGLFFWMNAMTPKRLDTNVIANTAVNGAQPENGVAVSAEDFISGN